MAGKDFFGHRGLFEALLDAEAGDRPLLPGFTSRDEIRRLVLEEMFTAAWRILDDHDKCTKGPGLEGSGPWRVELPFGGDGEEDDDEVTVSHQVGGAGPWLPLFRSKRAFLRASVFAMSTRGFPLMPVGPIEADDRAMARFKDALYLKLVSPRHGYTYHSQIDGNPLWVPRDVRDLESAAEVRPGQNAFQTLDEVRLGGTEWVG